MATNVMLDGLDIIQSDVIKNIKIVDSAPVKLSLDSYFEFAHSPSNGTVVAFDTNIINGEDVFYVELFDAQGSRTVNGEDAILTSITSDNFLRYVNTGAYDNSLIHRSIPDFVIQGGGFKTPNLPADQPGSDPSAIPAGTAIVNEPGNSNLRGTIAMAKLGGDPNSATNQFFFNLNDANSSNLDFQNGGFTVFGKVLGVGIEVVDMINAANTYNASLYYSNGALADLPLWSLPGDDILRPENFVSFDDVYVIPEEDLASSLIEYSGFSSNPKKLKVGFNGSDLQLTPVAGARGSVTVTVMGRSRLSGAVLSDSFKVNLDGGSDAPQRPVVGSLDAINQQKKLKTFQVNRRFKVGGQTFDEVLVGTKKKDKIIGSSRKEILAGFKGRDTLKGGGGADGFLFQDPIDFGVRKADKIKDFDAAEGDEILISQQLFGLDSKPGLSSVDSKWQLVNAGRTDVDFVYENQTGLLYFNENGDRPGWGEGGLFVRLQGKPELSASDLVLV